MTGLASLPACCKEAIALEVLFRPEGEMVFDMKMEKVIA